MKYFLLYCLTFNFICNIFSQNNKEFLIIPCKTGTLIIDGESIGIIEANDVSKQKLAFGEHYFQLKNSSENINLTISLTDTSKNIIKIGCDAISSTKNVRLINKELSLRGALSNELEQNIIGLDTDDEIIINSSVINKKGTATIFITEINHGNELYRKQDFKILENEKVRIPSKGIYKISLYTDALFGKDAKLTIDRVPSKNSSVNFKTTPKIVFDTTFREVLKTTTRVYSTTNLDNPNKTTVSINLPPNTSYWTYWIGVDQSAQDNMKDFINNISPIIKIVSPNPLVLYGMNLINALPMLKTPATINYRFVDSKNAIAFKNSQPYSYFQFKHADNITTDYSLINTTIPDLVLAMQNESSLTGYNVDIMVVAFIIKARFVLED